MIKNLWDKIKDGWDFFLIICVAVPLVFLLYPSWKEEFGEENDE